MVLLMGKHKTDTLPAKPWRWRTYVQAAIKPLQSHVPGNKEKQLLMSPFHLLPNVWQQQTSLQIRGTPPLQVRGCRPPAHSHLPCIYLKGFILKDTGLHFLHKEIHSKWWIKTKFVKRAKIKIKIRQAPQQSHYRQVVGLDDLLSHFQPYDSMETIS